MAMRDPYEILGVSRNATEAEIKKAYRRLARKHHPDVNPGDASAQKRFQEIAAAWEILKDQARRDRFDRTGETDEAPAPPPGWAPSGRGTGGPGGPGGGFQWSGDFRDLFSDLFAGGGGGSPFEGDDDAAAELTIPFRDAVLGGTVSFRAHVPRRCGRCGGTGRSGRSACSACRGAGSLPENEKVTVRVPAGVDSGSKIRVPGKGRTEQGDLYLSIQVEPHPYFRRDGDDIAAEVPVTVPEAYLGAEIEVPTIHGAVRARIPAGTVSGQRFRLKGKGVINSRTGSAGDHYYRVTVLAPDVRTEAGKAVVKELERLYAGDPRAGLPRGL